MNRRRKEQDGRKKSMGMWLKEEDSTGKNREGEKGGMVKVKRKMEWLGEHPDPGEEEVS